MAILVITCPHCAAERMTFHSFGEQEWRHEGNKQPTQYTVAFYCGKCERGVLVDAKRISNTGESPGSYRGDLASYVAYSIGPVYPSVVVPTCPAATPDNMAQAFLEGEDNFRRENWNSAGIGYRRVLELSTKGLGGDPAKTLWQRIDLLAEKHEITPAMQQWAHVIRVYGNEAAHGFEPFTPEQATQIRAFTELFLIYVYTLPQMLRERASLPK